MSSVAALPRAGALQAGGGGNAPSLSFEMPPGNAGGCGGTCGGTCGGAAAVARSDVFAASAAAHLRSTFACSRSTIGYIGYTGSTCYIGYIGCTCYTCYTRYTHLQVPSLLLRLLPLHGRDDVGWGGVAQGCSEHRVDILLRPERRERCCGQAQSEHVGRCTEKRTKCSAASGPKWSRCNGQVADTTHAAEGCVTMPVGPWRGTRRAAPSRSLLAASSTLT